MQEILEMVDKIGGLYKKGFKQGYEMGYSQGSLDAWKEAIKDLEKMEGLSEVLIEGEKNAKT